MLTLFTIPKPFRGHAAVIQNNAIRSWLLLQPRPEIILFGCDEGTGELASELGLRHIPDIKCNEYGTPLLDSIFDTAQVQANNQVVCYVNADIILMSDFVPAVQKVNKKSFLIVGRRWDLDVTKPLDLSKSDWEKDLRSRVAKEGKLHGVSGIDYFCFPKGLHKNIPPFAVGRTAWDNWLIYQARAVRSPVIDATQVIMIVHQNHDYSHNPQGYNGVWKGPESKRNVELLGDPTHSFSLEHATHFLTPQGVKPALTLRSIYFRLEALPVLNPGLRYLAKPMRSLTTLLGKIRSELNKIAPAK